MDLPTQLAPTRPIELLSPARSAAIARAAIDCGADAVYIGAERFGARSAAANSVDEIASLCCYAHRFNVRIYATLNTIIYESELREAELLATRLWHAGVDALIVQDMAMLRLDLPPIALHASTQCDIRTPEKARFLADMGFSRLVLPRELTLDELRAIAAAVPNVPLEVFVHGALCVSYSGDCQASYAAVRRSANRGECAQICRLPFTLVDGRGRPVDPVPRHYLSLRDLRRDGALQALMEAGAMSFKIEGRLKDELYVKNVTAYYRKAIDNAIAAQPNRYRRASYGASSIPFTPVLDKSFNRGFTPYFLYSPRPIGAKMGSLLTPKSQGEVVGRVKALKPDGSIIATLDTPLANGDGLGYFDPLGRFTGFRANRIEGARIFPASKATPRPGSILYRNSDAAFERNAMRQASRTISVKMRLWPINAGIALEISDERNLCVAVALRLDNAGISPAHTSQADAQQRVLAKLGGTAYHAAAIDNRAIAHLFIPASALTALRREAVELLDMSAAVAYRRDHRRQENREARWPGNAPLTRHDNVANSLAEKVYHDHGAPLPIEPAAEIAPTLEAEPVVMTTRYCLRRELGACLRTAEGASLPGPLTLAADGRTLLLRLDFDCAECRMHVVKL